MKNIVETAIAAENFTTLVNEFYMNWAMYNVNL